MIFTNRYFISSISFVILQQFFLAISTYCIASAGDSLGNHDYEYLRKYITLFFAFALIAYFLSSCVAFFQVKLKNDLWRKYILNILKKVSHNQALSNKLNREKTISWLTGEAPTAFDEISKFSADILSIYTNVLFTLVVFFITLNIKIAMLIGSALFFSVFFVGILKNKINNLADNIQHSKLDLFLKIPRLWDNHFFGNSYLSNNSLVKFDKTSSQHFKQTEKYVILEQAVACLPIYITVPLLIMVILLDPQAQLTAGALVAVLPRSLQLLGNVHGLSIYNSRFVLLKRKFKNLFRFSDGLLKQNLEIQINRDNITIFNTEYNEELSMTEFLEKVLNHSWRVGRYLITGSNGSGKTSLLKLLKASFPEAILLSAESEVGEINREGSLGQQQVKKIEDIFSLASVVYLLDEWDANLDIENKKKVDEIINKMKNKALIIEVRHFTHAH